MVARSERSFRRKLDDVTLLVQGRLRFDGWKPYAPPGAVVGQRLESLLDTIEMRSTTADDFDLLPIPYRAVAVDLATAEAVVIGRGSLGVAMRASMSIPGLFAPVELDGRRLADGGAVANLPVTVARDLGAESIIAVDISSPLGAPGRGFTAVFTQMNSMLTQGNVVEDIKKLGPSDVYIRPELGDISFLAFDRAHEAVALGEEAARLKLERLRLSRARSAHHLWRELPLWFPDGAYLVEGKVDLVFEEDGQLVVVDYKSDAIADEQALAQAAHHAPQLQLYGRGLTQALGLLVRERLVLFTALGRSVPV